MKLTKADEAEVAGIVGAVDWVSWVGSNRLDGTFIPKCVSATNQAKIYCLQLTLLLLPQLQKQRPTEH